MSFRRRRGFRSRFRSVVGRVRRGFRSMSRRRRYVKRRQTFRSRGGQLFMQ